MPLITVIIPTYNRKELLCAALDSVLAQEQQHRFAYEIYIIDDGSTDGTAQAVQPYLDRYSMIRYVWQQNADVGAARNRWLDMLSDQSDFVFLLDSDDEILPDCFARCLDVYDAWDQKEPLVLVWFYCQDQHGVFQGDPSFLERGLLRLSYPEVLAWKYNFSMITMMRSSLFRENPELRYPTQFVTETVLNMKIWKKIQTLGAVGVLAPFVGYVYRRHYGGTQKTTTIDPRRFEQNAHGNLWVIEVVSEDISPSQRAEYLFRAGVNFVMANQNMRGARLLFQSVLQSWSLRACLILAVSFCSPLVRSLFAWYIRRTES